MRGSDVFYLNIFQDRFNRIMKLQPKNRVDPARRLMEDMEEVFIIPRTIDSEWERKYPKVVELYEKVNMEALNKS